MYDLHSVQMIAETDDLTQSRSKRKKMELR